MRGRPNPTHDIIPLRAGNFVNQRPGCEVWNRLYSSRRRVLVRGAIVGYNDFDLLVGFIEVPLWVGEFLTSVASVEYKDRVPFMDTLVLAEVLKRLDDRRSGGSFFEQCANLILRNPKSFD